MLVQAGTLKRGDILVAGQADGKIRAMFDENGTTVDEATPARPVQVIGLNDVPEAGDEFRVVDAERFARDVAERRSARERRKELAERRPTTLEEFTSAVQAGDKATLNVIIKADVSGSAEALEDALLKLELDEVQVRVISKGVGAVTQSDVGLAQASDAIIVAFNVRPGANARDEIARSGRRPAHLQDHLRGDRGHRTRRQGAARPGVPRAGHRRGRGPRGLQGPARRVRVRLHGHLRRGPARRRRPRHPRRCRDRRGRQMTSLRRFKDDVNEVREGFECGIGLDKFQDVKVGDVFEAYETVEVARD